MRHSNAATEKNSVQFCCCMSMEQPCLQQFSKTEQQ